MEERTNVPTDIHGHAQQHAIHIGGIGDAVLVIHIGGAMEVIDLLPAKKARDFDKLRVALVLVLLLHPLHGEAVVEAVAHHPGDGSSVEGEVRVAAQGGAKRCVQVVAKAAIHHRDVQQVHDGFDFARELGEEVAVAEFVELIVGRVLGAAQEVVVVVAVMPCRN